MHAVSVCASHIKVPGLLISFAGAEDYHQPNTLSGVEELQPGADIAPDGSEPEEREGAAASVSGTLEVDIPPRIMP